MMWLIYVLAFIGAWFLAGVIFGPPVGRWLARRSQDYPVAGPPEERPTGNVRLLRPEKDGSEDETGGAA